MRRRFDIGVAFVLGLVVVGPGAVHVAAQAAGPRGVTPAEPPLTPPPASGPPGPPAPAPLVQAVEVGSLLGGYDRGFGRADSQSLRYRVSRLNDFDLALDLGREHRFRDTSVVGGAAFSKTVRSNTTVMGGWSSGTGEFISPRYRFDIGVTRPVRNILATVAYTHVQSRPENRTNGYSLGLARWYSHWVVSGSGRVDHGTPGNTVSTAGTFGLTWYRWRRTYIGSSINWGDVSYVLRLQGLSARASYRAFGGDATVSRWFNPQSGVNLRYEYGLTSFYRTSALRVSVFRNF